MKQEKITNICEINVGKTPSRSNPVYWGDGALWLSIADMNQGIDLEKTKETITEKAIKECNCKIVPQNSVVFSFKLSIGKVGITKVPMYTNEAIAAFIIKDPSKLDTKFLFYALNSVDRSIGSNKAVMGKTLNKEQLKKFNIPLPPLEDQKRIVKILDTADALRQKRKLAITLLDDYIKSVFLDLFGDPVTNPKGWETRTLKEVCEKITDGTHFSPPLVNDGIPYITAKHVKNNCIEFFENPTFITIQEHKKIYARCNPKIGDVLYIKDGATTGIAAINKFVFEFSMLSSLALLRPNKNFITSFYLCYWLNNSQVKTNLLQQMAGVAIQRFTLTKIYGFKILVPPLPLQDKFTEIAEKTDTLKRSMLAQSAELETQFQSLLQSSFRGEL